MLDPRRAAPPDGPMGSVRNLTFAGVVAATTLCLAIGGLLGDALVPGGRRLAYGLVAAVSMTVIGLEAGRVLLRSPWMAARLGLKAFACALILTVVLTPLAWLFTVAPFRLEGAPSPITLVGTVLAAACLTTVVNLLSGPER